MKYQYVGSPTHATIASGTAIANDAANTLSWTKTVSGTSVPDKKQLIRMQNKTGGPVYFRWGNDTACTIQNSDGFLADGTTEWFELVETGIALLNKSGAALEYASATKNFWITAWE